VSPPNAKKIKSFYLTTRLSLVGKQRDLWYSCLSVSLQPAALEQSKRQTDMCNEAYLFLACPLGYILQLPGPSAAHVMYRGGMPIIVYVCLLSSCFLVLWNTNFIVALHVRTKAPTTTRFPSHPHGEPFDSQRRAVGRVPPFVGRVPLFHHPCTIATHTHLI